MSARPNRLLDCGDVRCGQCTMQFSIRERGRCEPMVCPECRKPFYTFNQDNKITAHIEPHKVPLWKLNSDRNPR